MLKKHLPLLKTVVSDRSILATWIVFLIGAVILVITAALNTVPRDLQITTHYTAFGVTSQYKTSWTYLVFFIVFGILTFIAHTLIALKLYNTKGRYFTVLFLGLSVGVVFSAEFLIAGLYHLISLYD